ncbi:MAG: ribonuclease E/G, partial [Rubrivivax sp.]
AEVAVDSVEPADTAPPVAPWSLPTEAALPSPVPPVRVPLPTPGAVDVRPAKAEPYVLPAEALQTLAAGAGLQWVGSDAGKVSAAQAAMAAEPPPIHVPRAPRPPVQADDGPLVLVETRKDLSQLKLPFEQQQKAAPAQPEA